MQLERALVAQTTEAEVLGRRVQELESRLADQTRVALRARVRMLAAARQARGGQKTEIDLRAELASAASRGRSATESLVKEKALIEDQLAQSKAERTKLQQEIASMKREAEQTWAAERVENALLRERINDIAAEIARLTVALEGARLADRGDAGRRTGRRQRAARDQRRAQARGRRRRRQGQPRRPHPRPANEGVAGSRAQLASSGLAGLCRALHRLPINGHDARRVGRHQSTTIMTFGGRRALREPIADPALRRACVAGVARWRCCCWRRAAAAEDAEIAHRRAIERKTFTDAEIVDGFFKVTFGAEFHVAGGVDRIRKYDGPIRVYHRQPRAARTAARRSPRSSPTSARGSATSTSP